MTAWLRSLWRSLSVPEHRALYLGRALLLDVPVSVLLTALVSLLPGVQNPTFDGVSLGRVALVMSLAVPLIETVCLALGLEILRRFSGLGWATAFLAAALAAALHSWARPLWGPLVAWTFLLQARCYLTWRPRSLATAAALTFALHSLHNAAATALLAGQRAFTHP